MNIAWTTREYTNSRKAGRQKGESRGEKNENVFNFSFDDRHLSTTMSLVKI